MRRIDMTVQKYGRLTAVGLDRIENGHTFWRFRCDCGKSVVIDGWSARVKVNGKVIWLGSYQTKEEAITARREGEEKYYKPQLEKGVT